MTDRNKNRSGYRKTKVGWIPESWEVQAIGHLGQVQGGRQRSPHYTQGKFYPYLRVANIMDGYIDLSDVLTMRFSTNEYERYRLVEKDILLNEGQSLELVGRCAVYEGNPASCCFQNTLIRFRPGPKITVDFAATLFSFLQKTGIFAKHSSQTTSIAHLGVKHFSSILTILPSLPEQKKIAQILSTWEKAIGQTRRLIEAKKKNSKGLMQQLLWGRKRLDDYKILAGRHTHRFFDIPSDWQHPQLKTIAKELSERCKKNGTITVLSCSKHRGFIESSQYFGKQVHSEDTSNYKVIRHGCFGYPSNHIEEGSIGLLSKHSVGLLSPIYIVFECNKNVIPEYLYAVFKTETFRHIFSISTNSSVDRRGSLRWREFSLIRVPLPPTDEQRDIAQVLQTADQEIKQLETKLQALEKQKRGLMQKLLTGEIRVAT